MKAETALKLFIEDISKLKPVYFGFSESLKLDTNVVYINFTCFSQEEFDKTLSDLKIFENQDGYWDDEDEDIIHKNVGKVFIPENIYDSSEECEKFIRMAFDYMTKHYYLEYLDGRYYDDTKYIGSSWLEFDFLVKDGTVTPKANLLHFTKFIDQYKYSRPELNFYDQYK